MDDIVFNVLLLKGENGNSITNIEKTGTSGNTDTYTVTLTDGSTYTFDVTNGSNISSVEKTNTSGLVDTYTVTLTDGSTTSFEVTNGNGITNIEKTGTSGNTDIYTITYDNGNTSTFTVTNGTNAVDDALSTSSTNPVENRVVANAIDTINNTINNDINNHLKFTGDATESSITTAIQTLVTQALQSKKPTAGDIIDIVGRVSNTSTLSIFYSSLACQMNSLDRPVVVGVASVSTDLYKIMAIGSHNFLNMWDSITVTVTAI